MLNPYFILQSIRIELKVQKHSSEGVMQNVLLFKISQNTRKKSCAGVLFLTKMMAVKGISAKG